ncbi:GNAT family N-acetyltransferase [Mycoplasmatota bacterium WC30]
MVNFKAISENDISKIFNWLNHDHVSKYWDNKPTTYEEAYNKYTKRIKKGIIQTYLIVCDETEIGLIQTYINKELELYKIEEKSMGIDLFIGELDYVGKGIGPIALKKFIKTKCFNDKTVKYVTIDPSEDNKYAYKAYKKVGFKHVNTALCTSCKEHNNYYMILSRQDYN